MLASAKRLVVGLLCCSVAAAAAFTGTGLPARRPRSYPTHQRALPLPINAPVVATNSGGAALMKRRSSAPTMGLFGLGWAEIGVIGVLALLFFGPDKLAPLARDLGAFSQH